MLRMLVIYRNKNKTTKTKQKQTKKPTNKQKKQPQGEIGAKVKKKGKGKFNNVSFRNQKVIHHSSASNYQINWKTFFLNSQYC